MTTTLPSRAAIDTAEPLPFPDRKPAKQALLIVIKCRVDGFDCELSFSGAADQLLAVTKRLREIGAEPVSGPVMAKDVLANGKAKAKVSPVYLEDGTPMCPTHGKELKEGKWGLFCSAKDRDSGEYCKLKFTE